MKCTGDVDAPNGALLHRKPVIVRHAQRWGRRHGHRPYLGRDACTVEEAPPPLGGAGDAGAGRTCPHEKSQLCSTHEGEMRGRLHRGRAEMVAGTACTATKARLPSI